MSKLDVDPGYLTPVNIRQKTEEWKAELEQYCRAKKRFVFEPERSVLLVVDAQTFFMEEDSHAFIPASQAILPNISWLVSAYRQKNLPVIFTRHSLDEGEDPGIMGRWWADVIRESDPLAQVTGELAPIEGDIVIRKSRYSAFKNTGLDEILREMGIDTVVITGVLTHLCCESTARDSFMHDYETFIVIDGTASETEKLHLSSLRTLAHGFAVPVTTIEILSKLEEV